MTELEISIAKLIGRRYAVLVGTGTAALKRAFQALGIGNGDEVIIPSIVCYAVPFAALYAGAQPTFCDVRPETLNIDPQSMQKAINKRTKAVVAVHLFGYPCEIDSIKEIADSHGIHVIEDFAQGFGLRHEAKNLGSSGTISISSFGSNKIIDAGGGGVLLTDESDVAERARNEANQLPAKMAHGFSYYYGLYRTTFGFLKAIDGPFVHWRRIAPRLSGFLQPLFLFRLPDNQEARIRDRIQLIEDIVKRRQENAFFWRENLTHVGLRHLRYDWRTPHALTYYTCILNELLVTQIISRWRRGPVKSLYPPMHRVFSSRISLPVSEGLDGRLINFPVAQELSLADLGKMRDKILKRLDVVTASSPVGTD